METYLEIEALALRKRLANAAKAHLEVDPGLTVRDTPAAAGLLGAPAAELLPCTGYMHLAADRQSSMLSKALADSTKMP